MTGMLALFLVTGLFLCSAGKENENKDHKNILVFGGNGFIGSHVVSHLIEKYKTYNITLVSRGNWKFDAETVIKPYVTHFSCDRYAGVQILFSSNGLAECSDFMTYLSAMKFFDYVVDFSAYEPQVIKDALEVLKGKIGVYIYISTDSVYEVSGVNFTAPSKEFHSVRPVDPEEAHVLAEKDSYGDQKLASEEVLYEQHKNGGVPYVILRLPDVMGPRDSTNRWWFYILWVKFYHLIGVPIYVPPKVAELRTSYVYVKDVAQAVDKIIQKGSAVHNEVFNIAFDRDCTLSNTLLEISKLLGVKNVLANYDESEDAFVYFPSVYKGTVDIHKAREELNFEPTDWEKALEETVRFYEESYNKFPAERNMIIDDLLSRVVPSEKKRNFLMAVEQKLNGIEPPGT